MEDVPTIYLVYQSLEDSLWCITGVDEESYVTRAAAQEAARRRREYQRGWQYQPRRRLH